MAFNFGQIGGILSAVMDSDRIDIARSEKTTFSDGSIGVTNPIVKYTDVPCHLSYLATDNPDPVAVGGMPVITNVTINCAVDVDLQNGDYIFARKLTADGTVLQTHEGSIGAPSTNQSRKESVMIVRQGV